MDPLSMTASIIAVVQLTASVTSYLISVHNAASDQRKLALETTSLSGLLMSLKHRLEESQTDDEWFHEVKLLDAPNGPLQQFKDLLERIAQQTSASQAPKLRDRVKSALKWSFTKDDVEETLRHIERLKSCINLALSNDAFKLSRAIHAEVLGVGDVARSVQISVEQLLTHANDDERDKLTRWLKAPDCSTNYRAAQDKRYPGTGSWLLADQSFNDWQTSESSFLWIQGKAGSGKTILSTTALNHVCHDTAGRSGTAITYFYFDFNDIEKQRMPYVYRSLLLQFALQLPDGLSLLKRLYQKCSNGNEQPTNEQLQSLLYTITEPVPRAYIVLDALDECLDREELLTMIERFVTSGRHRIHVLATSRREKDIDESLRPIADHVIDLQCDVVDLDIDAYLRGRLSTDKKLRIWPPTVQAEVATVLRSKADGMFRWVYCQLESLRHCVKLSALRRALSTLPTTLDDTYIRMLEDIRSRGHHSDALRILQWLCFSYRPLRLAELVDMLAIEDTRDGSGGFDPEERLPDPDDVLTICSGLIDFYKSAPTTDDPDDDLFDLNPFDEYREEVTWVRLAHFSVKEFLLSDSCSLQTKFQSTDCHASISRSCLHYLQTMSKESTMTKTVAEKYALASYSARFWPQHSREALQHPSTSMTDLIHSFLLSQDSIIIWRLLDDVDEIWLLGRSPVTAEDLASPLYYAAMVGLSKVVKKMIHQSPGLNIRKGRYGGALHAASYGGHPDVVQLLLEAGADVNATAGYYHTALQTASERGHDETVQLLLEAGADVNIQGGRWGSPLQAAVRQGHENTVQILLKAGADVKGCGDRYQPLYLAAGQGNEMMARLLLDAGANVDSQNYSGATALAIALGIASEAGCETMVSLLLDAGADVNGRGRVHRTTLQVAVWRGHTGTVKRLLSAGWDVNIRDDGYWGTALQAASRKGREELVKLLLDAGADVNARAGRHGSALRAASLAGHTSIVRLLREKGAVVAEEKPDGCSSAPPTAGRDLTCSMLEAGSNGQTVTVP